MRELPAMGRAYRYQCEWASCPHRTSDGRSDIEPGDAWTQPCAASWQCTERHEFHHLHADCAQRLGKAPSPRPYGAYVDDILDKGLVARDDIRCAWCNRRAYAIVDPKTNPEYQGDLGRMCRVHYNAVDKAREARR